MRIIFSNQFGCHSKSEIILNYPELVDVRLEEHDLALEQGWLITAKDCEARWFQTRSTRVRLDETNYKFSDDFSIIEKPYPIDQLDSIYTKYCEYKNYTKYLEVGEFLPIDMVIGYYYNNKLTAWTKLRQYSSNSIESAVFAWDYTIPHSHLGITSLKAEIAWAKNNGYKYFYMGSSYEKNSIYKSDMNGFEWWTGSEWSRDKNEYIWLCKRDSKIASCHQIHSVLANLQPARNIP